MKIKREDFYDYKLSGLMTKGRNAWLLYECDFFIDEMLYCVFDINNNKTTKYSYLDNAINAFNKLEEGGL